MKKITTAISKQKKIDLNFILHLGDMTNNGMSSRLWEVEFFNPLEVIIDKIPVYGVSGNHEGKEGLFSKYFLSSKNNRYYSFNYKFTCFIGLDLPYTGLSSGSRQYQWLEQTLIKNKTLFTIVFFHTPVFGINPNGDEPRSQLNLQKYLPSLFEKHKVNLVLSGHYHTYQRFSINNVNYIVTGGGAHSHEITKPRSSHLSFPKIYRAIPHYLLIQNDKKKLSINAVNLNNKVIDRLNVPINT